MNPSKFDLVRARRLVDLLRTYDEIYRFGRLFPSADSKYYMEWVQAVIYDECLRPDGQA